MLGLVGCVELVGCVDDERVGGGDEMRRIVVGARSHGGIGTLRCWLKIAGAGAVRYGENVMVKDELDEKR